MHILYGRMAPDAGEIRVLGRSGRFRNPGAAIAAAYGLKSWRVENPGDLDATLKQAIAHDGPTLIDIVTQPLEQAAAPVRRWMG